jgi:thymidylate synthase
MMQQYHDLLKRVIAEGETQYNERTGQLMLVSAGDQCAFPLEDSFPLCTTKASAPLRWVAEEMFWMLRGERNAKTLDEKGVDIWNMNAFQGYLKRQNLEKVFPKNTPEWNDEFASYVDQMRHDPGFDLQDSDLGPIYGHQWRHWTNPDGEEVDQVKNIIEGIKANPGSRYHIMSAWNVGELEKMSLGPCHCLTQFTVTNDENLRTHMFQRSCDVYLGVPFNIAQYALLGNLVAKETGMIPKEFIHSFGNVHVYCGVTPRSSFLLDKDNLRSLQEKVKGATLREDFLDIRKWYLNNSPEESEGNEKKDHIPFILQQLSIEPRKLPNIEIADLPFFELIERPAKEVVKLQGYKPHKWDSKAVMAA